MAMASKTSPLPTLDSDNVSILLGDGTGNFSARHKLRRWQ